MLSLQHSHSNWNAWTLLPQRYVGVNSMLLQRKHSIDYHIICSQAALSATNPLEMR